MRAGPSRHLQPRHGLKSPNPRAAAPAIAKSIHIIRDERVIFDADLAKLYGVATKALNRAIKRNAGKFPADYMIRLTTAERDHLRCQIGTSKIGRGGRRNLPHVFTEHGAIMAANVLNSPQAVQISVFVIRAFIIMRAAFTDTRKLTRQLAALETELKARLDTHETAIVAVLQRIMSLLDPPPPPPAPPQREMGFHAALKVRPTKRT